MTSKKILKMEDVLKNIKMEDNLKQIIMEDDLEKIKIKEDLKKIGRQPKKIIKTGKMTSKK
jgi:hypothetical protein